MKVSRSATDRSCWSSICALVTMLSAWGTSFTAVSVLVAVLVARTP